ncbi:hypothetical protein Tco_0020411 [Tanacetum coccineum]
MSQAVKKSTTAFPWILPDIQCDYSFVILNDDGILPVYHQQHCSFGNEYQASMSKLSNTSVVRRPTLWWNPMSRDDSLIYLYRSSCNCSDNSFISDGANLYGAQATGVAPGIKSIWNSTGRARGRLGKSSGNIFRIINIRNVWAAVGPVAWNAPGRMVHLRDF